MKHSKQNQRVPGCNVILTGVPPGLLNGLPPEDQNAITEMVGKPILLIGYDVDDRAELKFTDAHGVIHFIYVKPSFIKLAK